MAKLPPGKFDSRRAQKFEDRQDRLRELREASEVESIEPHYNTSCVTWDDVKIPAGTWMITAGTFNLTEWGLPNPYEPLPVSSRLMAKRRKALGRIAKSLETLNTKRLTPKW